MDIKLTPERVFLASSFKHWQFCLWTESGNHSKKPHKAPRNYLIVRHQMNRDVHPHVLRS